jgi:hypothetical protein
MLRTCVLCCALAGVVGLTVGCNNTKDTKPEVKKKDEAVTAYKARLGDLDRQIADLKARAEKATGDDKGKLEAKLKEASAKREAALKKLDELEKAAADKWEAINKEADAAFEEVKKAVKE